MPKSRSKEVDPLRVRGRSTATSADAIDEDDSTEVLAQLLAQYQGGGGYSVRLERLRDVGMRVELTGYLGVLPLGPELYDDTMQAWGGGKYRGRIFLGNDYKASIQFQIAGEARPRDAGSFTGLAAEPSRTEQLLEKLLAKMDAPASPVKQFAEMAEAIKAIMPAPVPPPSPTDPLVMFKMFDTMLDLRQRVAEETGERPPDNGIATVVREGITPLIALVRERWDMDKTPSLQRRAAATGDATAPRRVQSSPSTDPIQLLTARIPTLGRAFLKGCAHNRKDPALYAEMVLDQIPPADYEALPELLRQPDFTQRLLAAVPEWEPYPVWFGELVKAMYASLTEEILVDPALEIDPAATTTVDTAAGDEQRASA